MVEDVCFLYKVLPSYFLIAPFYCQTRMIFFFICALIPFSHFSLLLLLLLLLLIFFVNFLLLREARPRQGFLLLLREQVSLPPYPLLVICSIVSIAMEP